jgi:hypothetical protein
VSNKDRWIIPLKEVPSHLAIHEYIAQITDLNQQIQKFQKYETYRKGMVHFDFNELKKTVLEGADQFGLYQFQYGEEASRVNSPYLSSSLTWNPEAYDSFSSNPHEATLGSSYLKENSASFYNNDHLSGKIYRHSYHDTYSFVERTPFSNHGALKDFLNSFQCTLIRSRVSSIKAGRAEATKMDFCWHNDESVFINLRINIPVQTSENYAIQIIKSAEREELCIDEFSMEHEYAYVYDTGKNHRPYCKKLDSQDRVHMICGVSPWFDFDAKEQCWKSNQYYGEVHPFEMFSSGFISPYLKG